MLGTADDRPWFNADYLAMVSTHVTGATFYLSGPVADIPELTMYTLVTAPELLTPPPSESRQFGSAVSQAISAWYDALAGPDGRELIRSYADRKGYRVSEVGDRRYRVDTLSGEHLFVDFEESGGIYGLELPELSRPEPAKPSWFGRLFGGKNG